MFAGSVRQRFPAGMVENRFVIAYLSRKAPKASGRFCGMSADDDDDDDDDFDQLELP